MNIKLHNDYPLAQDKIEIKRKILSKYQLMIADFYSIPIDNIRKLVPNFFVSKNVRNSLCKLATLLETRIKTRKTHRVLEFNQS